jgi:hypothetical protein
MDPLLEASRSGQLSGDVEMMCLSLFLHSCFALFSGLPLNTLIKQLKKRQKLLADLQQDTLLVYMSAVLQATLNLISEGKEPVLLTGEAMDENKALAENEAKGHDAGMEVILICKCFIAVYLNKFQQAYEVSLRLRKFRLDACNSALIYQAYFLDGLAKVVAVRKKNSGKSEQLAGKWGLNQLRRYFQHSPENVYSKILLIEAERCVLKGQYG